LALKTFPRRLAMITHRSPLLVLALLVGAAACDDDDDPIEPQTLVCGAVLEAANAEVETDATGEALFTIVGTEMDWQVSSTGLTNVNASHIHRGSNNSVLVPATGVFPLNATGSGSGTMTLTQAQLDEIETTDTYFNIHTTAYPGGEISGDLVCE
jgi:hypothetical protein